MTTWRCPLLLREVGSVLTYYREVAHVTLGEDDAELSFVIEIAIAKPDPVVDRLDSLLGRDILNRLRLEYDFPQNRLELVSS